MAEVWKICTERSVIHSTLLLILHIYSYQQVPLFIPQKYLWNMANSSNSISTTPSQSKPLSSLSLSIAIASLTGVSVNLLIPLKMIFKKNQLDIHFTMSLFNVASVCPLFVFFLAFIFTLLIN